MAVMPATKIESGQTGAAPAGGLMKLARSAGVLYLINIVGGAFAISIVPALLFGSGPAAMAHNIQTHELLYRSGLGANGDTSRRFAMWRGGRALPRCPGLPNGR